MHPLIEQHREAIRALCREFGVARLEVFGSIMTDAFDDASDVDFIVHYPEGYDFGPWIKRFFELKRRLESILGRPVDLIMADAIRKPRFIQSISEQRQVLFHAA
jgi:uncharacterized protein